MTSSPSSLSVPSSSAEAVSSGSTSTGVLPDLLSDSDRSSISGSPSAHSSTSAGSPVAVSPASDPSASTAPRTPASRTLSALALSFGIASFFFAQGVVVPVAAVILGILGLRDEPTGRSFSIWGIVLACVATFGWVLVVAAGALAALPFFFLAAAF